MVHIWGGGQQWRRAAGKKGRGEGRKKDVRREGEEWNIISYRYVYSLIPFAFGWSLWWSEQTFSGKARRRSTWNKPTRKESPRKIETSTTQNWSSNSHWPVIVILLRRRSERWFCKWRRFQWRERTTRSLCKQNTQQYSKIVSSVEHLRFRNVSTHAHTALPHPPWSATGQRSLVPWWHLKKKRIILVYFTTCTRRLLFRVPFKSLLWRINSF